MAQLCGYKIHLRTKENDACIAGVQVVLASQILKRKMERERSKAWIYGSVKLAQINPRLCVIYLHNVAPFLAFFVEMMSSL